MEKALVEPGLYDHLLTKAIEAEIARLGDPRLVAIAPVDSEESHSVLAQYLEWLIASSLALHRGSDAAKRQRSSIELLISKRINMGAIEDMVAGSLRGTYVVQRLPSTSRLVRSRAATN